MKKVFCLLSVILFFLFGCSSIAQISDKDESSLNSNTIFAVQDDLGAGLMAWRKITVDSLLKFLNANLVFSSSDSTLWLISGSEVQLKDPTKVIRLGEAIFGDASSSGKVTIKGAGGNILYLLKSTGAGMARFDDNGATYYVPVTLAEGAYLNTGDKLYFDSGVNDYITNTGDNIKIAINGTDILLITSTGVQVIGTITMSNGAKIDSGDKLYFDGGTNDYLINSGDNLKTVINGLEIEIVNSAGSQVNGNIKAGTYSGLLYEVPSITNPTLIPDLNYLSNGIGGNNSVALIVGGVTALNATSSNISLHKHIEPISDNSLQMGMTNMFNAIGSYNIFSETLYGQVLNLLGNGGTNNFIEIGDNSSEKLAAIWSSVQNTGEIFTEGGTLFLNSSYSTDVSLCEGGGTVSIGGFPSDVVTTRPGVLHFAPTGSYVAVSSSSGAILYSYEIGGNGELFVKDEAGNETQLSKHAEDAPEFMYDYSDVPDQIDRELNYYTGSIRFTNNSRKAKLFEDQLLGKDLPQDTIKRKIVFEESFDEYNLRTGSNLKMIDWDEMQDTLYNRSIAELEMWEQNKLLVDSLNMAKAKGDSLLSEIVTLKDSLNSMENFSQGLHISLKKMISSGADSVLISREFDELSLLQQQKEDLISEINSLGKLYKTFPKKELTLQEKPKKYKTKDLPRTISKQVKRKKQKKG